jgi:hypothetical protein
MRCPHYVAAMDRGACVSRLLRALVAALFADASVNNKMACATRPFTTIATFSTTI